MLRGLKQYVSGRKRRGPERPIADLAAVVTVTDDGGSSGRLRREYRILPPGDIRNCMVALSQDELLLSKLFQYRFPVGRGLGGHSFGNLFLTALTNSTGGDFAKAVQTSAKVLAIRGRIFPSTTKNVTLAAELEDGRLVKGETNISRSRKRIARVRLVPRRVQPVPEVLQALREADLILVGPGSLYTSILPNLLVAAGERSDRELACDARVYREPDDAARGNAALLGGGSHPGDLRAHGAEAFRFRGDQSKACFSRACCGGIRSRERNRSIRRLRSLRNWACGT